MPPPLVADDGLLGAHGRAAAVEVDGGDADLHVEFAGELGLVLLHDGEGFRIRGHQGAVDRAEARPPGHRALAADIGDGRVDVDRRDVLAFLARLHHHHAIVVDEPEIVVVAAQQHVDLARTEDLDVTGKVRVGDADDDVRAGFAQRLRLLADGGHLVGELEAGGRRHQGRLFQRHAEHAHPQRAQVEDLAVLVAGQLRAVRGAQIGGHEQRLLLGPPLQVVLLAEIELVVARDEHVRRHDVQQFDGMRALVEARHQGRRVHVAGVGIEHRNALGALGAGNRGQAGEASAATHFAHLVDVVDEQEPAGGRHALGCGLRQGLVGTVGQDRGRGQAGGYGNLKGLASVDAAHVWLHSLKLNWLSANDIVGRLTSTRPR